MKHRSQKLLCFTDPNGYVTAITQKQTHAHLYRPDLPRARA
ncbi:hypothetical protein [Streptomyces ficellus]|nr:hypothetical protein [Streptomyces ficellus]